MPNSPKTNRRGEPERNRKNRLLTEKPSSFNGRSIGGMKPEMRLRRPHTVPDLLGGRSFPASEFPERVPKPTKLLFNVTVQGSVGAVQVLTSPEKTVGELVAAAVRQYGKEGRRPIVESDPGRFQLHYSQFSLESLGTEEKLVTLGSRNFFLCAKKESKVDVKNGIEAASSSCSKEAEKANDKNAFAWLKLMDFLGCFVQSLFSYNCKLSGGAALIR